VRGQASLNAQLRVGAPGQASRPTTGARTAPGVVSAKTKSPARQTGTQSKFSPVRRTTWKARPPSFHTLPTAP
jgi:hypothetical protein